MFWLRKKTSYPVLRLRKSKGAMLPLCYRIVFFSHSFYHETFIFLCSTENDTMATNTHINATLYNTQKPTRRSTSSRCSTHHLHSYPFSYLPFPLNFTPTYNLLDPSVNPFHYVASPSPSRRTLLARQRHTRHPSRRSRYRYRRFRPFSRFDLAPLWRMGDCESSCEISVQEEGWW